MRTKLVSWLAEVAISYDLNPETMYITVNLIDRYCDIRHVPLSRYQLLGVASLFIASKYEELYPKPAYKLAQVTDNAFTI